MKSTCLGFNCSFDNILWLLIKIPKMANRLQTREDDLGEGFSMAHDIFFEIY